ncbi:MAG: SurA N-terminal domain-containing protein [Candidatus Pacebacteria bacterium]|nr:SurA N-terminal domain-containing protein [Candidatus Paceibacterota bacterium]
MNDIETRKEVSTESTQESPVRTVRKQKKNTGMLWALGLVLGLGVALGGAYTLGMFPSKDTQKNIVGSKDPASLVASVNGVDITRAELDKKLAEVQASYPEGAGSGSGDAAIETQVLDEIINLRLLTGEAEKQGIAVTDEEVNAELTALVTKLGGEEAFKTQLTAAGLTQDELTINMRNEILIRKLLDVNTDLEKVTASDEEIAALYKDAVAQAPEGQDIPPLADVTEMARAQVVQEKSAKIVTAYIDTLRASAKIDITL